MAKAYYFDTEPDSGFTLRTHLEESNGMVSVTKMQLQSKNYAGPVWYPGGDVKVNDEVVLSMSYLGSATHMFSFSSAGDAWVDIEKLTGVALPVSSGKVKTLKATISVDVTLYRNSSSIKPVLSGSIEISVVSGAVRIETTDGVKRARAYVKHNGVAVPTQAVTNKDGNIMYCN